MLLRSIICTMVMRKDPLGRSSLFSPILASRRGGKGKDKLTVTSFSIPESSVDYWMKRFDHFHVEYEEPEKRFDEVVIYFEDHDGLGLELVANTNDQRPGFTYGNIPLECAIQGFYGMTLSEECYEKTAGLLVGQMDHTLIAEKGNRFRYSASGMPGDFVDVLCSPESLRGIGGYGTVHHVAFATASDATQLQARSKLVKFGLNVTPVLDREYFHSIYFREPGGVLFEIATIPPGFAIDEPLDHLGESFKLPPWEEKNRSKIEKALPKLVLDIKKFADVK